MTHGRYIMHCPRCSAPMYESRPISQPQVGDVPMLDDWVRLDPVGTRVELKPGELLGCAACGWVATRTDPMPVESIKLDDASVQGADSMWGCLK